MKPFQVVRNFEVALCEYTGAPYAVTTTSCTMALLLALAYHLGRHRALDYPPGIRPTVEIPKYTYVGVPMSIIHAGGRPVFRDTYWRAHYQLKPYPIWDSARWFTSGLYDKVAWEEQPATAAKKGGMVCVSFHWAKTLGIQQGGAILHDDPQADVWLRRARFDGREEGVDPKHQNNWQLGWHAYMSPEIAAEGLVRLANLPLNNEPIPNSDYPDLSEIEIFR